MEDWEKAYKGFLGPYKGNKDLEHCFWVAYRAGNKDKDHWFWLCAAVTTILWLNLIKSILVGS